MSNNVGEKLAASAAVLAASASLALVGGCSAESGPPKTEDTAPLIADYLATHPSQEDLLFDPQDITSTLQHATLAEGRTSWYDPPLKKSVNVANDTSTPSAKLLEVHADNTGKLHYTASDKVPPTQLNQLLRSVDQQQERLRTVMGPDAYGKIALDTVTFRVFDTEGPAGKDLPGDPAYGEDTDTPGKSNLYYFLSGDKTVSTAEITDMLGHEAEHAALGHRENKVPLTADQKTRLRGACKVLAKSAMDELMSERGYEQLDNLKALHDAVDPPYQPAFDTVKNALEDGTYTELPKFLQDDMPGCVLEAPTFAANRQATMRGLDVESMVKTIMGHSGQPGAAAVSHSMGNLVDEFYKSMRHSQAFRSQAESTYLPAGTAPNVGHPSDDVAENMASTGNVAISHPKEFTRAMNYKSEEVVEAVGKVLAVDAEILAQRYPGSQLAAQTDSIAKQLTSHK